MLPALGQSLSILVLFITPASLSFQCYPSIWYPAAYAHAASPHNFKFLTTL